MNPTAAPAPAFISTAPATPATATAPAAPSLSSNPTPILNQHLIIVGTAEPGVAGDVEMALAYSSGMQYFSAKPLHLDYTLLFAVMHQAKCRLAQAEGGGAGTGARAGMGKEVQAWIDPRPEVRGDDPLSTDPTPPTPLTARSAVTTTLTYTTTVYNHLSALAPLTPRTKPSYRATTCLPSICTVVPFGPHSPPQGTSRSDDGCERGCERGSERGCEDHPHSQSQSHSDLQAHMHSHLMQLQLHSQSESCLAV